jgi:hypothetical protein
MNELSYVVFVILLLNVISLHLIPSIVREMLEAALTSMVPEAPSILWVGLIIVGLFPLEVSRRRAHRDQRLQRGHRYERPAANPNNFELRSRSHEAPDRRPTDVEQCGRLRH